jgi:hypothetical protein
MKGQRRLRALVLVTGSNNGWSRWLLPRNHSKTMRACSSHRSCLVVLHASTHAETVAAASSG